MLKSCDISNISRRKHSHIHTLTDPITGEVICISCGAVISDKIAETRPEWSVYGTNELNSRSRVGMPISLAIHDLGLSTVIGKNNKDFSGKTIVDTSTRTVIERIRTLDYRTQTRSSKDQSRKYAFRQLNSLKEKLALPSPVLEKAAYIYRKAQQNDIIRGRTRTGAMGACVYIACREAIIPRAFDEVAEVSNIRRKEMWKAYRAIVSELDLKVPLIDPVRCLVKLANKMGVSEKVKRYGINYMKQVIDSNFSAGRDPMGLAATVLYISCQTYGNVDKSQKYFAETAGISDVTVRNRRQELRNKIPGLLT
ncbi:MAG: transcription initiation factor IIB [Nitrososphaeraceae archaeon]